MYERACACVHVCACMRSCVCVRVRSCVRVCVNRRRFGSARACGVFEHPHAHTHTSNTAVLDL